MISFTPFAVVCGALYLLAAVIVGVKKRTLMPRQLLMVIFFVYLLAVIKITLFPIPLVRIGFTPANNLIPFHTIFRVVEMKSLSYDAYNLGGNILLFVPLGFLLPVLFNRQDRFLKVLVLGLGTSFIIESSKFLISFVLGYSYRDFDVDDLILNTLGALIGYALLRLLLRLRSSRLWRPFQSRRFWMMGGPIVLLLILGCLWGYEYVTHSTPERSQARYDSNVLPLTTVPLSSGVVLITATDPHRTSQPGYMAWYFQKTRLWGWRLEATSTDIPSARIGNKSATFASMTVNGQTFAWGTQVNSQVATIIYRHNSQTYNCQVGARGFWHLTLPSSKGLQSSSHWSAVLRNGTTIPAF